MSPPQPKHWWNGVWKISSKLRPIRFDEITLENFQAVPKEDGDWEGESPLLEDQPRLDTDSDRCALPTDDVYDRFSREQKRVILAIVALTGLIHMFVSGCFIPSIPQMSKDLDSTPTSVSLGVSLALFASSFGAMFWSAHTSFYGRRAIYLFGIPFTIIGSFAISVSTCVKSLLFWRFVQTFGCSGGYVIGAAVIGDIYKVEERGTAVGTLLGATLFGLAIAPSIGGFFAQYWSWRGFQVALGVWGMIQMILLILFFPETAHPGSRGIDKVRGSEKKFVLINPLRGLTFLRSPNIIAIALANTFALVSGLVLLVPIAYTVGTKYRISNEALIGALFLPNGFGNVVGSPLAGRISDTLVRRAKEERKGVWVPEDRLHGVWIGELLLIPISVTLAGFTTAYIDGMVGLVINLVCLFTNGVGVDMVLTPIGTYTVDIMPSRSAEVAAAISALRSLLIAPATTLLIPSIETIGVAATNTISGVLALVGYFLIWLTIRYGELMRAYVDVGYPDFNDQHLKGDENSESQD